MRRRDGTRRPMIPSTMESVSGVTAAIQRG